MSIDQNISGMLAEATDEGQLTSALVCTDSGLLVASEGHGVDPDQLAGLTSLFDDILMRSRRDLSLGDIDEVTLLDPVWGRCVVRPINLTGEPRFFLVVRVDAKATWRAHTNKLRRQLIALLVPLVDDEGARA